VDHDALLIDDVQLGGDLVELEAPLVEDTGTAPLISMLGI
jgi:hypothetical protein